jgi:signal transduction histidine kinase
LRVGNNDLKNDDPRKRGINEMPLSRFIFENLESILVEWERFARTILRAAARILNSGTRMKSMVPDLLDFASTRLGDRMPLSLVSMNLEDACRSSAEEICAFHPSREILVQCEGELSGRWDSGRIAQMLSNLLGNAVKHGSATAPVLLHAIGSPAHVRIEIHNQGRPIPVERRRSIFEPLTRGISGDSGPRDIDRSIGLGLYIAGEIAKAHGGSLELTRSDEDRTTFVVRLPRSVPQKDN